MFEKYIYWLMQNIGYRKIYYDKAFLHSINLDSYESWVFSPKSKKGTYREIGSGWKYVGYGVNRFTVVK